MILMTIFDDDFDGDFDDEFNDFHGDFHDDFYETCKPFLLEGMGSVPFHK